MRLLFAALLLCVALAPPGADAQTGQPLGVLGNTNCNQAGGYPFTQGGCLNAADLNKTLQLSAGLTPPQNTFGQGAGWGALWIDTSVTPARLRECNVVAPGACSATFNPSQWIEWAAIDAGVVDWPLGGGLATVPSAGVVDLGLYPQAVLNITGTASISSFGSSLPAGRAKILSFSGTPTLVYGASSIVTPFGQNIATSAGSVAVVSALGAGKYSVLYQTNPTDYAHNVPTNTALKALSATAGTTARRSGFGAAGDAPSVDYVLSATNCSLNAGLGDNGIQVQALGGGCWNASLPGSGYDVRVWGADPTGTAASSSAVQAALDALCTLSPPGGVVLIPAGTYKFHDVSAACGGVHVKSYGNGGATNASIATSQAGTIVNCTGMAAFCVRLGPSAPAATRVIGNSVEGLQFTNTGASGAAVLLNQVSGGYARDLWFNSPTNAIKLYGTQNTDIHNIKFQGITGIGLEITGDLLGKNSAGSACSVGDCTSRADITTISMLNGVDGGPQGSIGIYIHEMAFGTIGDQVTWEGGQSGIKVRCAAGATNLSSCPQQIRFTNFENEFGVFPLDLQDFTWFKCDFCYFAGPPGGGSDVNVVSAKLVNYSAIAGAGGGVDISHSEIFGANHSCTLFGVTDVTLTSNQIFGCNLVAGTYAAVELNAGNQATISNNQFCKSLGAVNGTNSYGVLINSGYSNVLLNSNAYLGCGVGNILNNSASPATVYETNPLPAPPFGTISAISGCGSTCAIVGDGGNELGGRIKITPSGSGIGATATFTLSMPQPLYPNVNCTFKPSQIGTGAWVATASAISTPQGGGTSSVTVVSQNAATNLTSGSTYELYFNCAGY